jgi:DNA-binding NtrC family response regulator
MMKPRVLIVDDEVENRNLFARFLADRARTVTAASGQKALELLNDSHFDVVLTDLRMPGLTGIDLASQIRKLQPLCEVILVTAFADLESAIKAVHLGVVEYLQKPLRRETLQVAFARALEKRRMLGSLQRGQEENEGIGLGRILGSSTAMVRLRESIVRVQHLDATVLITGETGTGKELVARALHEGSHRSSQPFLTVNCAAMNAEILESELFGHEAGAFTGATQKTVGLLEAANGGTFFLDEVGECPKELQAKLLRVLQEREVLPVGGRKPRPIDIRLIAATNRRLEDEVKAGNFREDLFFRLNVFPLRTLPLREIPEDIEVLAAYYARQQALHYHLPVRRLSPELVAELKRQPWKGNVRELQNTISRIVILGQGESYTVEDLRTSEGLEGGPLQPQASGEGLDLSNLLDGEFLPTLEEVERTYIRAVLDRYKGKKLKAAEALGIHRVTLNRKLERWEELCTAAELSSSSD